MTELEEYEEKEQPRHGYSESRFSAMKRRLNLQMLSAYIRDGSHKQVISKGFYQRENESSTKLKKQ